MAAPASPATNEPTDPIDRIDNLLFGGDPKERAASQPRDPRGKFTKPEPTEPEPVEAREEPEESELEEPGEPETDESEEEPGEPGEAEPESEPEAGEDLYTFKDLAEGLEIPEDELASQIHLEGPDGQSVPLAEVIKSYREQPERAQALVELTQERESLQAERTRIREEKDQHLNRLAALSQAVLRNRDPEAERRALEDLRANGDTQGFLLRKAELEEQDRALQSIFGEFEAEKQKRAREDAEAYEEFVTSEVRKLKSVMPTWRDRQAAAAAMDEIGAYLRDVRGFSEKEVNELVDHRQVMVAWDAAQFRRLGKKKPEIASRLAKLRKGGATASGERKIKALPAQPRQVREKQATRELRASRERLRKTGSDEAADDYFGRIM